MPVFLEVTLRPGSHKYTRKRLMKYIIANWKMHSNYAFVQDWGQTFVNALTSQKVEVIKNAAQIIISPPFPYIHDLMSATADQSESIILCAQNVSHHTGAGAYTGEVSAEMLKDIGCQYVLVGHSERRAMGDNDLLEQKLKNVLEADLIPVFCVGEPLEEREAGRAWDFIANQLSLLKNIDPAQQLLIAYEPIWAIGTGQTANLEDIEEMHTQIKAAYNWPVLYGGSVKSSNAGKLLASSVIDGALVGGASLKPDEFLSIVEAAS